MDEPSTQLSSAEEETSSEVSSSQDSEADQLQNHRRATKELVHRNLFGPQQLLPPARFTILGLPTSFKSPKTVAWKVPIAAESVPVLLNSTIPASIDDKLMIWADGPDVDGAAYLHIRHVWSNEELIGLQMHVPVQSHVGSDTDTEGAQITAITWDDATDWEARTTKPVTKVTTAKISDANPGSGQPFECVPCDGLTWQVGKEWLSAITDRSTETLVKYVALEACRWLLHVQLMDVIPEPEWFKEMPEYTYPERMGDDSRMLVPPPAGGSIHKSLRQGDILKFSEG